MKELFGLIHQINPTDRGLDTDSELERYRLKSALQSLLIRTFPEAVRVRVESNGTLALNHPMGTMDACHAVLSELDGDAQSWVRGRLDDAHWDRERPAPAPEESPSSFEAPSLALNPLESGKKALAQYDFERAIADFTAAVRRPLLRLEAATELVGLLVETLADHERAEQAAEAFPAGVADDPDIAGLLAVGAARAGALDRAWELLPLATGRGAVEALLLIGRGAALQGRRDRLDAVLARLPKSARGARAELVRCREALLTSAVSGQLNALRTALDADDFIEAETIASTLEGKQLPAVGQALLTSMRELKARRARAALEGAVADAEANGDLYAAAELAWTLAESAPVWEARASALDEAAYSTELAQRVSKAEELLRTGKPVAVYAWLALPEEGRLLVDHPSSARLREHAARLDAAFDEDPDAVGAAQQLCEAESCSTPGEALALLAHPMLAKDPVATAMRERELETLAAEQKGAVGAALAGAREALARGDWARTLELLAPLPTDAAQPLVLEASALRNADAAIVDAPLTALALMQGVPSLGLEESKDWLDRIRARIQVACEVIEHPTEEAGLLDMVPRPDEADRQLTTHMFSLDAERFCLFVAGGQRVLIRVLDTSGALMRAVTLRVPEPLELPAGAVGEGDQIFVLDSAGWLLTITLDGPAVLSRVEVPGLDRPVAGLTLVGHHFLWALYEGGGGGSVIDVRDGRMVRSLADMARMTVAQLASEPVVVVTRAKQVTTHRPDGRGTRVNTSAWRGSVSLLADRSRPGGLLRMDMHGGTRELSVLRGVLGGGCKPAGSLGTVKSLAMWASAAAPPYLMYRTCHLHGAGPLVAYAYDKDGALVEQWRSAPVYWAAAASSDVGPSLVLICGLRRPWIGPAGASAPPVQDPLPSAGSPPPLVGMYAPCAAKKPSPLYEAFDALIEAMSHGRRVTAIAAALESPTRPGRLNALAHALLQAGDAEALRGLLAGVDLAAFEEATATGGGQVRRGLARAAAAIGDWDTVVRFLDSSGLERRGALGQHAHHLLGVALLRRGETADALAVLRAGQDLVGGCPLDLLIQSADPGMERPA